MNVVAEMVDICKNEDTDGCFTNGRIMQRWVEKLKEE